MVCIDAKHKTRGWVYSLQFSKFGTSQALPCTKIDAFEIALSFVLDGGETLGSCHVRAKPSQIRLNDDGRYWDEWKFAGRGRYEKTTKWEICQLYRYVSRFACKKCKNDEYENIALYKAEKGTHIYLSDNSDFFGNGAYTKIEILKNINRPFPSRENFYEDNPIRIYGLEQDKTTEYYKMTNSYTGSRGPLNREVSNVRVYFNHRK